MKANVKFAKVRPDAKIPTRGSNLAAGYDLYAACESTVEIMPHETKMIGTGLSIQPPSGYFGAIFARSGLAAKRGLRPANCVGVCDEDYTGEYIVALHNDSNDVCSIHSGDRIAQLVFMPYISVDFEEVDSLNLTTRGSGGFGSTGR
jgi:dUTP pyrophosphatase